MGPDSTDLCTRAGFHRKPALVLLWSKKVQKRAVLREEKGLGRAGGGGGSRRAGAVIKAERAGKKKRISQV